MARRKTSRKTENLHLPAQAAIDRAVALSSQADELYKSGAYEDALHLVQHAIDMVKPYKNARMQKMFLLKGYCLYRLGRIEEAIPAVELELRHNPGNQTAQQLLAHLRTPAAYSRTINLEFDGLNPPATWPAVSLCMIVKNEEKHLADCLRSVGDFASEIIIVDTGSTDRTVAIAREFGARVEFFEWIDDFAAARNYSISFAAGEWIFWMDADDRLSPASLNSLKQAIVSDKAEVYSCWIRSNGRAVQTGLHHRLFPNRLGIEFKRPLHEQPNVKELGLLVGLTNIEIEHIGYNAEEAALRAKAERNQKIILQALLQEPDNIFWQFQLGISFNLLGQNSEAIKEFEQVLANPLAAIKLDKEHDLYTAYISLIDAYNLTKQPDKVFEVIDRALREFSGTRHLHVIVGQIHLLHGHPQQAVEFLEKAMHLQQCKYQSGMTIGVGTLEQSLSRAYLQLGRMVEAKNTYLHYLQVTNQPIMPVQSNIRNQAEELRQQGRHLELVQLLGQPARCNAEMSRLLANSAAACQQWAIAGRALEDAIMLSQPSPGEWTDLSDYMIKAELYSIAGHYSHIALANNNQDVSALNQLGIIAYQQKDIPAAIQYFAQAVSIEPTFTPACNNLEQMAQLVHSTPQFLWRQYGLKLFNQQKIATAITVFSTIIERYPDDVESYRTLAAALQKIGQQEDALLCWQTAQRLSCVVA